MGVNKLSRRDFLKLISLTGVGITSFANIGELVLRAYRENENFLDLVKHSIKTGKALQDVGEILQSRVTPDKEIYSLGREVPGYSEGWMDEVTRNWEICTISEIGGNIGFFDITDKCGVTSFDANKIEDIYAGHPNRDLLGKVAAHTLDFDGEMNRRPFMTLPNPQYDEGREKMVLEGGDDVVDYYLYTLHAKFRINNDADSSSSLMSESSGKRGGLILTDQGMLIVATPEEFVTFNFEKHNLQAQMEFAFVIDSNTVESDLALIESQSGLKLLTTIAEYYSWIVTFYDAYGNPKTILVSTIGLLDDESDSGKKNVPLTIPQFVNLTNDYAQKHGYKRYAIAVPDTASRNELVVPMSYRVDDADRLYPGEVLHAGETPLSQLINGDNYPVYRAIGGGTKNFVSHPRRFPQMITVSAS